jgi:hypothetical protein
MQLKCGESHITYLARNTVKNVPFNDVLLCHTFLVWHTVK